MRNIEFSANGFTIIDLVPNNDLQTGRTITGNLQDIINSTNCGLFCERQKCVTRHDLFSTLNDIKKRIIEKGETTYIHIEGHGSKDNLLLLDGTEVSWSDIFSEFREINILCKNNLFFSSGACHSAYAFKAATIDLPCPIFGMLAPEKKVEAGDVVDGYTAFYKSLILNENMNDALKAFSSKTNSKDFALIFTQLLFEQSCYDYIKNYCMGRGRQKRLDNLVTEASPNINKPLNEIRRKLRKQLQKPQARQLTKFHNKFMMIDMYTENKNRFIFNAVKFERDVRLGKIKNI